MLHEPDEDGKRMLSGREWDAIRRLQVSLDSLSRSIHLMEDRLKIIPNGWRDIHMLLKRTQMLLNDIYETVPTKHLWMMQREIEHSEIRLTVHGADSSLPPGVVYVDEKAFLAMLDKIIQMDCWACEKKGKDVKRCEIRKVLFDCLQYGPDASNKPKDGSCELAGQMHIGVAGDEDA